MKKQIIKNLVSNYVVSIVGLVLGFVLVPFLIAKIGTADYGVIVLAESTVMLIEIVTSSLRVALARHATFALASGDSEGFAQYLSTGRYLLFAGAAFVFGVGSIISYYFPVLFRVLPESASDSRLLCFFIVVAVAASIPNIVFWSVLYAKQRFDLINFSSSFGLIVRALSIFALFSALPARYVTMATYGLIYLAMTVTQNFMVYIFQRRLMPTLKLGWRHCRGSCVRAIVSFGAQTSLGRASAIAITNVTNILINLFWGPSLNAVYAVAVKFPIMMRRIFLEATWALTPTFTELLAKNDRRRFEQLFFFYSKTVAAVTMPLCLILSVMAGPVIRFWVGPEFALAARLLPICMLPLLMSIPFSVCSPVITAYAKVRAQSLASVAVNIFNVVFAVYLGVRLSMGLYGFAVAAATASFLYSSLFSSYYACRISGISLWRYWLEAFVYPAAWSLLCTVAGFWLMRLWLGMPALDAAHFFGIALLSTVCYAGAFFLLLNGTERRHLTDLFKAVGSKLGFVSSVTEGGA